MLHDHSLARLHATPPARRARQTRARALLCALALAASAAPAAATTVLITEVVDGPLGPGQPKFVELTIINDFDLDLSNYSIGVFQDGSNLLAGGQSMVLGGTIFTGQYIIAFEDGDAPGTGTFRDVYGADPDHFGFGAILDGDDAIALFVSDGSGPGGAATGDGSDATLLDVYGVIGVDGTGQPWEYSAGFAVRCAPEPSPVFTPWEWSFSGPGALEAGCSGDEPCETQNLLQLTDPFGYECPSGGQLFHDTCFGDGAGAPCGCGNESSPGSRTGCLNGLGLGARLFATGTPSVSNDTLVLRAGGVPAQPGLFFQGNTLIGGGSGVTFGDGVRCAGQGVVRVQIVSGQAPEPTLVRTTVPVSTQGPAGTVLPGDIKNYQYWYRDPAGSPCGTNFNLSNATRVLWF